MNKKIHMITGAYGYSGKYIAHELLNRGYEVNTLTDSINRENPFGERVKAFPFNFENPTDLKKSLEGVTVLYNTYWVRFNHRMFTHSDAIKNTLILFKAAKEAGVERIIHVSITNPSIDSNLEYYKGKAILEKALIQSGISYSILRPAVLFGKEDILINNIAWVLRRFPVYFVFSDGSYRVQPINVEDFAKIAVEQSEKRDNNIINAVGPERLTYKELIILIGSIIGKKRPIISIHPFLGFLCAKGLGLFVGDVLLTWEEIKGLMADTLSTDTPPTGTTKLSTWIREHAETTGKSYTSELVRRKDRRSKYKSN